MQDPVIFSGTVRSNLDPFGDAGSDEAIWEALARVRASAGRHAEHPEVSIQVAGGVPRSLHLPCLPNGLVLPPTLSAQAGLEGTVRGMEGGLDAKIAEGGGNLSVGQRQVHSGGR